MCSNFCLHPTTKQSIRYREPVLWFIPFICNVTYHGYWKWIQKLLANPSACCLASALTWTLPNINSSAFTSNFIHLLSPVPTAPQRFAIYYGQQCAVYNVSAVHAASATAFALFLVWPLTVTLFCLHLYLNMYLHLTYFFALPITAGIDI